MNVELLKRVADVIVARPSDFDMSDWIQEVEYSNVIEPSKSCGTVCCIAGWAHTLSVNKIQPDMEDELEIGPYFTAKILDLTDDQEEALFYTNGWPTGFNDAYQSATTDAERAQVAYDRIHHFIQTEGHD